jgi:hypothetical protein
MKRIVVQAMCAVCAIMLCVTMHASINTGSDGHDGAFNPTTSTNINMADHPDGIYQYSSVNIRSGVTVSFTPNANNTPVIWLVQSNCVIDGAIYIGGEPGNNRKGGLGGPGGYRGGNSGSGYSGGQGPGGGQIKGEYGGHASYATLGKTNSILPGVRYGNTFLIPLVGGSGGGGCSYEIISQGGFPVPTPGGGGGGGAILIAASNRITLNGQIRGEGGSGDSSRFGAGSGGAVRIVCAKIEGWGEITVLGGGEGGGAGWIRFDAFENAFSGTFRGEFSQGFQPIIFPTSSQGAQLSIASVGGASVSATPSGQLISPDTIISGQQANPISIVVHCSNLPLNTPVIVTVKPANSPAVSATGLNNTGTFASSTATISINMPRGGGIIYATAAN